jgi:heme exporter protein A
LLSSTLIRFCLLFRTLLMRLFASDLACRRGGRDVFAGVSFAVASGESLTIRGRNGAGKSSLLRMVVGLVRIAAGNLALDGGDPELTVGEQAHYLGHQDALKPSLSVAENLHFWSAFLGLAATDPNEPLAAVGLDTLADLPAAYLSAGQRRRLSIARLLAVKRPIWLLDEPTSTLDTAAQARLGEIMQAHLAGGGIILAATHGTPGLDGARELRLDQTTSSLAQNAPSPLVREGWGGGSSGDAQASTPAHRLATATTNPSPQGGGEQRKT